MINSKTQPIENPTEPVLVKPLKILYHDEHYVAIDKPSGLLVHRSPIDKQATEFAIQRLRDQIQQCVYPCHRLDRPTSGVLLFALNKEAMSYAQNEFAEKRVQKAYTAICRGWIQTKSDEIDYPLKSEEPPYKTKEAVSRYQVLEQTELPVALGRYSSARFSLVELTPITGRKHQLRRHLAHIRHPILGDTRHGDGLQNRFLRKQTGQQQLMLRSIYLKINLQNSPQPTTIRSGSNAAFQAAAQALGFESSL